MAGPDLPKEPPPAQGEEKADRLDLTAEGLDLTKIDPGVFTHDNLVLGPVTGLEEKPYDSEETRENTRGDLARGLLWLLTLVVGGVLVFIGLGRLDGTVLTQSTSTLWDQEPRQPRLRRPKVVEKQSARSG